MNDNLKKFMDSLNSEIKLILFFGIAGIAVGIFLIGFFLGTTFTTTINEGNSNQASPFKNNDFIVKPTIVNTMTSQEYSNSDVKIGYYQSADGEYFTPIKNYTDPDGTFHIELTDLQKGYFYAIPKINNNTQLYIDPAHTQANEKEIVTFDFNKYWIFKFNVNYFPDQCQDGICATYKILTPKIYVYSYDEPKFYPDQDNAQITGITTRAENKTAFNFVLDSGDCTVLPITGVMIKIGSLDTVNWYVKQSKIVLSKNYWLNFQDAVMWTDNSNTYYGSSFIPYKSGMPVNSFADKGDGLKYAYYLPSHCGTRTSTPFIDNILTTNFPSRDYTLNVTETLFYALPNGTQRTLDSSYLLCASQCFPLNRTTTTTTWSITFD